MLKLFKNPPKKTVVQFGCNCPCGGGIKDNKKQNGQSKR